MEDYLKKTYIREDIDALISSNVEEGTHIEFKRGDALNNKKHDIDKVKKDIAKDVSAFANADGGIIFYGVEEKNHKATNTLFVNGNEITKEWLEQIINSNIERRIDGVIIDPIRYENNIEKTIYVVKIPRSLNAPQMTKDKKFYKRRNFQCLEMEEYEIRDLYTRQEKTKLKIVKPKIMAEPLGIRLGKMMKYSTTIHFNIENAGQTIEKFYKLEIKIPYPITSVSNTFQSFFNYHLREENEYSIFSIPNKSPLFQNELATIGTVILNATRKNLDAARRLPILIRLYYSNGTEEYSFNLIDEIETQENKSLTVEDFYIDE
jgi:hypothetical protein